MEQNTKSMDPKGQTDKLMRELVQYFPLLNFRDQREIITHLIERMIQSNEQRYHEAREKAEYAVMYVHECEENYNISRSLLDDRPKREEPMIKESKW